jgi:hypothetical protein
LTSAIATAFDMPSAARRFAPLALLLALAACAAAPQRPSEYLDETTGATITSVEVPLVFARARPELAYGARDYVTLAAANVNRTGHVEQVFLGYIWSTIDPRMRRDAEPARQRLIIFADDRLIELSSDNRTAQEVGIAHLIAEPPGANATQSIFPTDTATLRFLAAARRLRLSIRDGADPRPFDLWGDGRGALAGFLAAVAPN